MRLNFTVFAFKCPSFVVAAFVVASLLTVGCGQERAQKSGQYHTTWQYLKAVLYLLRLKKRRGTRKNRLRTR